MPQRQGTIIRGIMRTEMANLPGKCLHKHHRQFKLSVASQQDFFLLLCPHVYKCLNTCCSSQPQAPNVFRGYSEPSDSASLTAVRCAQMLKCTPVSVSILLIVPYINKQWKQSVKRVDIYVLHYQVAWPGPLMRALTHISH